MLQRNNMARTPSSRATMSEKKITEVTSVISHQLKTPLAGIKSSLEILLSGDVGPLTKSQREYLELTLAGSLKMIQLVKNLLDASRIDENRMKLTVEKTDLILLIQGVIDDLSSFARAKNSSIDFSVNGEIPLIRIDATRIQQVVSNLIYNAIRYTKGKGDIRVSVRRDGDAILFTCADNGIGIPDKEKKKIFTKFYRSPRVVALATDGSGLGLFISKAIIMRSGGKIWFTSKLGKGTIFYFMLPIR